MADQHSEKYVFAVDIEMQMKKAAKQVADFEKQLLRVTKLPEKFKKAEKKALTDFVKGIDKSKRGIKDLQKSLGAVAKESSLMGLAARKQSKLVAKAFSEMEDASNALRDVTEKNLHQVNDLQKKLRKSEDAEEKKRLAAQLARVQDSAKAEIEMYREVFKAKKANLKDDLKSSGALQTIKAQQHEAKKAEAEFKKFQDAALEAGATLEDATTEAVQKMKYGLGDVAVEFSKEMLEGVKEAVEALGSKDLGGVAKGLGKGLLKGMAAGASGMGKWGEKNKDKGGVTGMAAGGMSSVSKAMGGMAKSMGPMIGMLSKMGPLLSLSASIIAGIIKVFLDAEAQAKQFNKDILESASSAEFLASSGGDANKAYKDLDKTLDDIRDHAFDAQQNMKWGISASEHKAVLNILNQEGVSLKSLTQGFKNAGDSASTAAAAVQDWTDMTHMAVTYSRNFGVSLQEIGTMQAEMFTEMGSSLSTVQLQFGRMQKDAAESGIAANKFFNIIRGVSSDLALYNTRLEQTTSILKLLGKAMSPKNAQKFLQTMSKGMKDMSEEDRIKATLIAGEGKQREIVEKDLARKEKLMQGDLAKASGLTLDQIQQAAKDAATDGGAAMDAILKQVPDNARAAYKEAMSEMKMDKNALKNGGVVGLAEASSNLSAAGAFASKKAQLQRFGGNKKLSEMTGIQGFAARKATGTSLEEFRGAAKLEAAIDDQKKEMVAALTADKAGTATKDQKEMADRLKSLDMKDEAAVTAAGDADIIAAMAKSDQEALATSQEQVNWAEKSAGFTSSISDKMEAVIDGIFEYLFVALKDVISDINEFINLVANYFGKARPEKEARDSLRANKNDKNGKIIEAMQKGLQEEGPGSAAEKMIKVVGPMLVKGIGKASSAQIDDDVQTIMAKGLGQDTGRIGNIVNAEGTTIDKSKKDKYNKLMEADPNRAAYSAMKEAGFDSEDMKKFLEKSVWGLSPTDIGRLVPDLQTTQLGGPGKIRPDAAKTDGVGGTKPSAQAEAGQKAAAPGTQGAMGAGAGTIPPAAAASLANVSTSSAGNMAPMAGSAAGGSSGGAKQAEELIKGNDAIHGALRQQGIKVDKSFLTGPYEKSIKDATLDAMREALFEYALYTSKDPAQLLNRMQGSGLPPGGMASTFSADPKNAAFLTPNSVGGTVVGVAGGKAVVASPGEGLASVGKGETISPAGGGSGGSSTYQINVNGIGGNDLARFLQQRVSEIIYEYKKREKFG